MAAGKKVDPNKLCELEQLSGEVKSVWLWARICLEFRSSSLLVDRYFLIWVLTGAFIIKFLSQWDKISFERKIALNISDKRSSDLNRIFIILLSWKLGFVTNVWSLF